MPSAVTLNDMLLVVHFDPPLALDIMSMADWAEFFRRDFGIIQQLPPHPPVSLNQQLGALGINVLSSPELPRLYLHSKTNGMSLQLQSDRFGFGWARHGPSGYPAEEYPGYEGMLAAFHKVANEFYDWHESRIGGRPNTKLLEIVYYNAISLQAEDRRRRFSEVFRFVPEGYRPMNAFNIAWSELLTDGFAQGPRVTGQAGLGIDPSGEPVFAFTFAGMAPFTLPATSSEASAQFSELHARIIDMRAASIILTD